MADWTTVLVEQDGTAIEVSDVDASTVVTSASESVVVIDEHDASTVVATEELTAVSVDSHDASTVVVRQDSTVVVASGVMGPPGPPGPPGSGVAEDIILAYDVNDVLQSVDGETFFLEMGYDGEGRLVTVTDTTSGQIKTLAYDVNDLLVSVTVTP